MSATNEARPDVVTLRRPFLPRPMALVMLVGALVFGAVGVLKGVLPQTEQWTLECTRTAPKTGTCTVTHRSTALGAPETRSVDLATIVEAKEIAITGNQGKKVGARVVLQTTSGEVDVSRPHASESGADDVLRDVSKFLGDDTQPALSIVTQAPTMPNWPLLALLFGLGPLAITAFLATRSSKLVVDRARRVVRVSTATFPFGSTTSELPLDAVTNAVVEETQMRGRNSRGSTVRRIALLTTEGKKIGFGMFTNDGRERLEALARSIDAALSDARA